MLLRKKYRLKLLAMVLCFLSLLLVSCDIFGGGNNDQAKKLEKAPANKQVFTISETGISDFDTLDPALAHDTASINAIQMMFTGLVQLDDKLQVHPQLARSWEMGDDGLTWTFHLRPNLKFSDGTALTSADVAYSIDRSLQPKTQSRIAPIYLGLVKDSDKLLAGKIQTLIGDSLKTPDPNTLVITTRQKAAYFLAMLAYPSSYVVEKKLIDKYGTQFTDHLNEGGSSGPFKVAQYTHHQGITFVPNAAYYNDKPQLQKVIFTFFHTPDEAYQAYQNNKVDTSGVPIASFATDKKRPDFFQIPALWTNYYTMNYLVKPFDNIHIRQAFALAIDKTSIANNVWKGTVAPTNHIVPQGMAGYNPKLTGPDGTQGLSGDASKAQALLKQGLQEEGWSDVSKMPAITLTYAKDIPNIANEVPALVEMWKKVLQVTVATDPVDYDTLLDKVTGATNNKNGLQFWGLAWIGEYPDAQDWLTRQFDVGSPNNNMNYGQNDSANAAQQKALQQQMEAADSNFQQDGRIQSYQKIEQQLVNDVAWIPMEQITTVILRTPNIVGIVDNAQNIVPPTIGQRSIASSKSPGIAWHF
ncbi:peptide ABC transporter substrate-binding protein [Ktedonosporobacter rubrisoli]|uniref:peptide ABC transporter substrate-binding protein n=1 Tax=Ktedonosporobacter rubrisoli TaxID=2509675 RepID=UPI001F5D254F|nr:peptide ABC transporter substrate-binding protein [Ktedonosporobacter rubrisoli]